MLVWKPCSFSEYLHTNLTPLPLSLSRQARGADQIFNPPYLTSAPEIVSNHISTTLKTHRPSFLGHPFKPENKLPRMCNK